MLYWPVRSPESTSSLFPGGTLRSLKLNAASIKRSLTRARSCMSLGNLFEYLPAQIFDVSLHLKLLIMLDSNIRCYALRTKCNSNYLVALNFQGMAGPLTLNARALSRKHSTIHYSPLDIRDYPSFFFSLYQCSNSSTLINKTSLGLLPLAGPTMPNCSI